MKNLSTATNNIYQYSLYTGNAAKEAVNNAKSNGLSSSTINSTIDMEDFLKLMVAQLQNQTMYDTVDNSEMLAQLAQYSSIQAMTEMANSMTSVMNATNESLLMNSTSYAASLVGKEVTAAETDENGDLVTTTGTVSGIGLFEGNPVVYIGNKAFNLGNIMVIGKAPEATKPAAPDTENNPETNTDTKTDPSASADPDAGTGTDTDSKTEGETTV